MTMLDSATKVYVVERDSRHYEYLLIRKIKYFSGYKFFSHLHCMTCKLVTQVQQAIIRHCAQ